MRKVLQIARREYLAAVKTKGFIIGIILAPVLMCGGFIGMALLKDQVDVTDKKVAVVDRSGFLAGAIAEAAKTRNIKEVRNEKTGKKVKPAYLIEVAAPNTANPDEQRLELSNRVRDGKLHAFLEIGAGILHPSKDDKTARINYYAKNAALDDVRQWVAWPVNDELRRRRLAEVGIDHTQVKNLFDWISVESMGLISRDTKTGEVGKAQRRGKLEAIGVPMVMVVLIFMLLMTGATPLLQVVMEEKNQRIAEVMLSAVTPFQFMLGKLLGGVGVSLTGSAIYLAGGSIALSSLAASTVIPYRILPWFFAYLMLAVLMLGATFAAVGSACNDAKDAQSLQLPVMLPIMIPMFILGPVLKEPHSAFATWASLFPPFTPVLMLLRQSMPGGVPMWQPWVGLLGLLLFTVAAVWVGGRVFRVGILMQGKSPKFSDLVRWAIKG